MKLAAMVGACALLVPVGLTAQAEMPHAQLTVSYLHVGCSGNACGSNSPTGISGGVGLIARVAPRVGLMPEIGLERESLTESDGFESAGIHEMIGRVSLLVRPQFGTGKTAAFLLAGPFFRYALSCGFTGDASGEPCSVSGDDRTDYGLVIGGGVLLGKLVLQARYDIGLKNFASNPYSLRSTYLLLGGGIAF